MFSFLLIAAIAYGVAFWIASTGAPVWRAVVGFSIALVVGWVGGTGIAVFLLSSIASTDAGATTFNLLGKGFWLALFGAGYGVHRGRGKLKAAGALQTTAIQKIVPSTPAGNDAYAAALAEIEEVRLDKGVWARSFAESGGDESKAKASYIKARAESLKNAEGWVHARPPTPDAFGTNGRTKGDMPVTSNPFPIWVSRIAFGLALIGIWLAIGIPAYRERNQSQAASQTLPAKQANPWEENYGGGQAPSPTPSAKQNQPPQASETGNQISFGENDKIVPPPNVTAKRPWSGKPFDKNDTTAEIERLARQFPQINESRAWAAVVAWQANDMRTSRKQANEALFLAVGTVLDGLNENKGVCRPGRTVVLDNSATSAFPAGFPVTAIVCDR